jgi:hypothetical protein
MAYCENGEERVPAPHAARTMADAFGFQPASRRFQVILRQEGSNTIVAVGLHLPGIIGAPALGACQVCQESHSFLSVICQRLDMCRNIL